jgi:GLPGLI family protein
MKTILLKTSLAISILLMIFPAPTKEFQGKAIYYSKAKMQLGSWGARLSEAQKKQIQARLKNRLEKTYILTFNQEESMFLEKEKIDAVSGATDSWGGYFSRGDQYKNIKQNQLIQSQEFYGKRFLVKDQLYKIDWKMGTETKNIGKYTTYKATASVPKDELEWYNFSWSDLRRNDATSKDQKPVMIEVEAWYTPEIPVAHGPGEYWGLPGLILEVSAGNTTLLCSEIEIGEEKKIKITAPSKGKEISKKDYTQTIRKKMQDMRSIRMGRRRGR